MKRLLVLALLLTACATKKPPVVVEAPKPVVDTVKKIARPVVRPIVRPPVVRRPKVDTVVIRDTVYLKPPMPIKPKKPRKCKVYENG